MPVTVIGEDIHKAAFRPAKIRSGKSIDVTGHELEVIGVMNPPAASLAGPG